MLLGLVIGAEREWQGKPAGMRTHALIAVGAALFVLAGRYGFAEVDPNTPGVDPARIAAQVVTGVGFLGAGVIFFRRNLVFGMTTAASIWSVTAIAIACAAGLPWAAVAVTAMHLIVVAGLAPVENAISRHAKHTGRLHLRYLNSEGLTAALAVCTAKGFNVVEIEDEDTETPDGPHSTEIMLAGRGSVRELTESLNSEPKVLTATFKEEDTTGGGL
ncbi:MgtC/SapB family protein [Glycomyces sp. NPDC046736]|uniref:MgtC/SapB family protein n=1 Tax=Glycomyces sp. NPDC046736 TaxID=3155615 RepID=UPI0033DB4741